MALTLGITFVFLFLIVAWSNKAHAEPETAVTSDEMKTLEQINKNLTQLQEVFLEKADDIKKNDHILSEMKEKLEKMQIAQDALEKKLQDQIGERQRKSMSDKDIEETFSLIRAVRGISHKTWDRDLEKKLLRRVSKSGEISKKALIEETGNSGGAYLVPEEFSRDLIKLVYNRSIFDKLSVRKMMPTGGTLNLPKITGGATFSMVGYTAATRTGTVSSPTASQLQLTPHKGMVIVPVGNELVARADPDVEQLIKDDMVKALQLGFEYQFLFGNGQTVNIDGLYQKMSDGEITEVEMGTDGAKFTDANGVQELLRGLRAVENENHIMEGWAFNTNTMWDLRELRDANDNYLLTVQNNMGIPPMLLGYPYAVSNIIPQTLTKGQKSDCTCIFLGEWSDVITAMWRNMTIRATMDGSYTLDAALVSCNERDETLITGILEGDIQIRHDPAIAVITGVRANTAT